MFTAYMPATERGGTPSRRSLYGDAMSDTQIVELDEPEATATHGSWRAGSVTILAVPVLLAAFAVAVLTARTETQPAVAESPLPTSVARPAASLRVTSIITAPPNTPSVVVTESGDPEVLADRRWSSPGPAYPARGDVAEAVLYGDIYVIGGTGTIDDGRSVFRYDAKTGARQPVPDLPISLDHAMAATLGGRVFVFGGFVFGQASARVFSFGTNDARWIEHSPMPAARAAGGAAVLDDHVYLVGGVGATGGWLPDTWVYEVTGRWSTRAALPTPRDHLAVAAYRGSICAAGGNGGPWAFECYEPVRDQWTKRPNLRKPVLGGRAAEAAGWFWVVERDVHAFDGASWNFGPRLESPRAGGALVAISEVLYFVEGATGPVVPMEMLKPQR